MVFSRIIFGFIVPKEDKKLDPKEIQAMVNMHVPQNYNRLKYSMVYHNFTNVLSRILQVHGSNY
jgi:hypothetical protein